MNPPSTEWTAIKPGVLSLPQTLFTIVFLYGEVYPFRVFWNGEQISNNYGYTTLARAKERAIEHMAELMEMGFEV